MLLNDRHPDFTFLKPAAPFILPRFSRQVAVGRCLRNCVWSAVLFGGSTLFLRPMRGGLRVNVWSRIC
jgi:hypothetical protein